MLNRVPFAGAGWIVRHGDAEARGDGHGMQGALPLVGPATVGATSVNEKEQVRGFWIPRCARLLPPQCDVGGRKRRGIPSGANHHIGVSGAVVKNGIRDGNADSVRQEVMAVDVYRRGGPRLALVLELPNQFPLLCVLKMTGWPAA